MRTFVFVSLALFSFNGFAARVLYSNLITIGIGYKDDAADFPYMRCSFFNPQSLDQEVTITAYGSGFQATFTIDPKPLAANMRTYNFTLKEHEQYQLGWDKNSDLGFFPRAIRIEVTQDQGNILANCFMMFNYTGASHHSMAHLLPINAGRPF